MRLLALSKNFLKDWFREKFQKKWLKLANCTVCQKIKSIDSKKINQFLETNDESLPEGWECYTEDQFSWINYLMELDESFDDYLYDAGFQMKNKAYIQVLGFIKAAEYLRSH